MAYIENVIAREILDSRGNPTIEVDCILDSGCMGRAAVPSGASTGQREALELRDNDPKRFLGKGVLTAVQNVNDILAPEILGYSAFDQVQIDRILIEMDGTDTKEKLGANAILGISMAVARAAAEELGLPLFKYLGGPNAKVLPVPMMNIINGGAHADNNLDIQEFMIIPRGFSCFSDALRAGVETFHSLKKVLKGKGLVTSVGDEGGFAPILANNEEALQVIMAAIEKAGYHAGQEIFIGLDCAASEFYKGGVYRMAAEKNPEFSSDALVDYYDNLIRKYPIVSIEDGMAETDWDGWKHLTDKLGSRIQIIADDLVVTNPAIIRKAITKGIANSILIKLNQIGSVTETLDAIMMTQHAHYRPVISHRSGETEDAFIADLAVATNAGQIKTGSASRSDRLSKYNQLLRISEFLGSEAIYSGTLIDK